jgi:hypothetical protein
MIYLIEREWGRRIAGNSHIFLDAPPVETKGQEVDVFLMIARNSLKVYFPLYSLSVPWVISRL